MVRLFAFEPVIPAPFPGGSGLFTGGMTMSIMSAIVPIQSTDDTVQQKTAIAVRDWATTHETGHTRRRKSELPWVCLPTRHDGNRYRRITRMERGLDIYAVWCLIISVAGRCLRRGVLIDEYGEPLTCDDLEGMTGFPAATFEFGIAALMDEKIGWLERVPLVDPKPEEMMETDSPASGAKQEQTESNRNAMNSDPDATATTTSPAAIVKPTGLVRFSSGSNQVLAAAPGTTAYGKPVEDPFDYSRDDDVDAPLEPYEPREPLSPNGIEAAAAKAAREVGLGLVDTKDLHRRLEAELALEELGFNNQVEANLYRHQNFTSENIHHVWSCVKRDSHIRDKEGEFIRRLKKYKV